MIYNDIIGKALIDYHNHIYDKSKNTIIEDILTWTSISDIDTLPTSYFFRSFDDMPAIEKFALEQCYGKILDVGCGAGSHSLYLQNKGFDVKGIDISDGAIRVSKKRSVLKVEQLHLLDVEEKFDTILLLMNGTGIFQEYDKVQVYLKHLKSILNPNGQILIDSSDIKYMFDDEFIFPSNHYYGELDYYMSYKGEKEKPMKWLYLDFENLKKKCTKVDLKCDKIMNGKHFDYLAKISSIN
ncbi:class I SAM-dependent methyltransferase [Flavobacteriaceae bacterium 14752]|uniref:class I SAM-dependent methyltransferase n=1 Tax=Mesohalobacter salilacus TaxID=2491711 RepID=UPI000F63EC12|nr:class I SAM-dependent methyltransferase [Flavobacteriaceae bacterium 14752]